MSARHEPKSLRKPPQKKQSSTSRYLREGMECESVEIYLKGPWELWPKLYGIETQEFLYVALKASEQTHFSRKYRVSASSPGNTEFSRYRIAASDKQAFSHLNKIR